MVVLINLPGKSLVAMHVIFVNRLNENVVREQMVTMQVIEETGVSLI